MVEIDGVLISDSIFEEQFICDLKQCRGACCVEGERVHLSKRRSFHVD